jgi:hypothetical protein
MAPIVIDGMLDPLDSSQAPGNIPVPGFTEVESSLMAALVKRAPGGPLPLDAGGPTSPAGSLGAESVKDGGGPDMGWVARPAAVAPPSGGARPLMTASSNGIISGATCARCGTWYKWVQYCRHSGSRDLKTSSAVSPNLHIFDEGGLRNASST